MLTDRQTIVYRDLPAPGAQQQPEPAPTDPQWRRQVDPDPVLLFRYSALTFNSHRIHYDRSYATGVEGYPGLVVHGPLVATLLLHELIARHPEADIAAYRFRAVRPLFDTAPFLSAARATARARPNSSPPMTAARSASAPRRRSADAAPPDRRCLSGHREAVRALCVGFPDEYHRKIAAAHDYPEAFVEALTQAGWLAAMIPQEYGGSGLGLAEASVIMEEINRSGGNAGACHGQMYNMGTLLRHGSDEQKQDYLPRIASGELRLQSMAVTEPTAGTDTTKITTTAVRKGDRYLVSGQKVLDQPHPA